MPKRAKQEQREFTELFIRIADPGQANAVVKQGLLLDNRWHKCKVYDKDCRVKQCFNCWQFRHVGRFCRRQLKCKKCVGFSHSHYSCLENKNHCIGCRDNHPAWSRNCPVREKDKARAAQARAVRPIRFQEHKEQQQQPYTQIEETLEA
jgi:hypothetical protein